MAGAGTLKLLWYWELIKATDRSAAAARFMNEAKRKERQHPSVSSTADGRDGGSREDLKRRLERPDAALDVNIGTHIRRFIAAGGTLQEVKDCLCDNLVGYPSRARQLAQWVAGLPGETRNAERLLQEQYQKLLKDHFDAAALDAQFFDFEHPTPEHQEKWQKIAVQLCKHKIWRESVYALTRDNDSVVLHSIVSGIAHAVSPAETVEEIVKTGAEMANFRVYLTTFCHTVASYIAADLAAEEELLQSVYCMACTGEYTFIVAQALLFVLQRIRPPRDQHKIFRLRHALIDRLRGEAKKSVGRLCLRFTDLHSKDVELFNAVQSVFMQQSYRTGGPLTADDISHLSGLFSRHRNKTHPQSASPLPLPLAITWPTPSPTHHHQQHQTPTQDDSLPLGADAANLPFPLPSPPSSPPPPMRLAALDDAHTGAALDPWAWETPAAGSVVGGAGSAGESAAKGAEGEGRESAWEESFSGVSKDSGPAPLGVGNPSLKADVRLEDLLRGPWVIDMVLDMLTYPKKALDNTVRASLIDFLVELCVWDEVDLRNAFVEHRSLQERKDDSFTHNEQVGEYDDVISAEKQCYQALCEYFDIEEDDELDDYSVSELYQLFVQLKNDSDTDNDSEDHQEGDGDAGEGQGNEGDDAASGPQPMSMASVDHNECPPFTPSDESSNSNEPLPPPLPPRRARSDSEEEDDDDHLGGGPPLKRPRHAGGDVSDSMDEGDSQDNRNSYGEREEPTSEESPSSFRPSLMLHDNVPSSEEGGRPRSSWSAEDDSSRMRMMRGGSPPPAAPAAAGIPDENQPSAAGAVAALPPPIWPAPDNMDMGGMGLGMMGGLGKGKGKGKGYYVLPLPGGEFDVTRDRGELLQKVKTLKRERQEAKALRRLRRQLDALRARCRQELNQVCDIIWADDLRKNCKVALLRKTIQTPLAALACIRYVRQIAMTEESSDGHVDPLLALERIATIPLLLADICDIHPSHAPIVFQLLRDIIEDNLKAQPDPFASPPSPPGSPSPSPKRFDGPSSLSPRPLQQRRFPEGQQHVVELMAYIACAPLKMSHTVLKYLDSHGERLGPRCVCRLMEKLIVKLAYQGRPYQCSLLVTVLHKMTFTWSVEILAFASRLEEGRQTLYRFLRHCDELFTVQYRSSLRQTHNWLRQGISRLGALLSHAPLAYPYEIKPQPSDLTTTTTTVGTRRRPVGGKGMLTRLPLV
ncbi:unnamed protein product [Vitrella brassicaformis CCMP3155]|uniref:Uncharacterized protein n=2 Tax=Vitrella brassicaformis TaxID=1169539 RepID=A0A0G4GWH6_VITBC|nr:unnamed protein product [Vitrella brassicaformis CCMP3155]|eukprot:CEM35331.1 unnamed protein product [Vitrella brassicaformis CCMP3155]